MIQGKKVGLALSGGGYRAAAYHLGTLRKLNELGILDKVDIISAVSGGSIIAAAYALHNGDFASFEKDFSAKLKASVIKGVVRSSRFLRVSGILLLFFGLIIALSFTKYGWLSFLMLIILLIILVKYQFKLLPISKINEQVYDELFFKGATLNQLTTAPIIAINSTNLDTGRAFTFSHCKMSDSTYAFSENGRPKVKFKPSKFPVSRAVAASTCVPFAFTPITINKEYYKDASTYGSVKPMLIDGGVYDNQGVHKLTQPGSSYECDIIIVSDAGNTLPGISQFQNTIGLLVRTSDIFMSRIKNFQMAYHLFDKNNVNKKEMAYQSLGWDHNNCIKGCVDGIVNGHVVHTTIDAHGILSAEVEKGDKAIIEDKLRKNLQYDDISGTFPSAEEMELARSVSTNLTALTEREVSALSKHAAALTEIQIKLFCPSLFRPQKIEQQRL